MTDCSVALNPEGLWQCQRSGCGWIYSIKTEKPPRRNCPKATDRPKRDPEEVEFIRHLCECCNPPKKKCRCPSPEYSNTACPCYHW